MNNMFKTNFNKLYYKIINLLYNKNKIIKIKLNKKRYNYFNNIINFKQ